MADNKETVDRPSGLPRRILLVEPTLFIHTLDYIRAALKSTGFENAHFTLLTTTGRELDQKRVRMLESERPNLTVHLLDNRHLPSGNRLKTLRQHYFTVKATEELLSREKFDLVIYLYVDLLLAILCHPRADRLFPAHRATGGICGLLMTHNGLRPSGKGWKNWLKGKIDRRILSRAVRGGWFRKLAFLDHRSAEEARRTIHPTLFVNGVDPIDLNCPNQSEARRQLNLPEHGRIALLFGAISDRKAVIETLDILSNAPHLRTDGLTLLIGGPVDQPIRPRREAALERARKRFPVVFHDGFVADEDLPRFFASADLIVCAYKNFTASSGTLLHAAAFGKPALVAENGVMDDAVKRFGCGETVTFSDPEGFARKFDALLHADPETLQRYHEGALRYAATMDARRYMSQFL